MSVRRLAMVVGLTSVLAACGPSSNPQTFLDSLGASPDVLADKALAALVRGDYAAAEEAVDEALKRNPRHHYALLAGGLLYQNTNRPLKARSMYEELLALRPSETATVAGWTRLNPTLLSDIARKNLRNVESTLDQPAQYNTSASPYTQLSPVRVEPVSNLSPVTPPAGMSPYGLDEGVQAGQPVAALDPHTQTIADRFIVLRELRDGQLISSSEYSQRRNMNIGGLLPLTKPPAAEGLDRPVPGIDMVVDRLKALQQSLQMRAITPREHAMERELILDALLPAKPETLARPEPAPTGLLNSADRIRQLERLRTLGLITTKEMQAEQKAIEQALKANAPAPRLSSTASDPQILIPGGLNQNMQSAMKPEPQKPAIPNNAVTVHLSSYRSMAKANAGWDALKKKFPNELGILAADIRKVSVKDKGTYYRLHVGPLDSRAAANRLCVSLRKQRQFCSVSK